MSMGLQELLECVRKSSSDEIRRQIEFVLQQLEAPAVAATEEAESDDEEDEEDTDDPTEPIEGDLEDFLRPSSSELQGEELLCHRYLLPANSSQRQEPPRPSSRRNQTSVLSDNPLSRPITPRSFAHKQNNQISLPPDTTRPQATASDDSLQKSKQKASGATTARRPNSANKQTYSRISQPPKSQSDPSIGPERSTRNSLAVDNNITQSMTSTPENQRKSVVRSTQLSFNSLNSSLSPGSKLDPQPSVKAIKHLDGQISREVMHEYKEVFVSRPRINRTPEPDGGSPSEQANLTRSGADLATDSLADSSYAPLVDSAVNDETNNYDSPNIKLEFEASPPKVIPSTRSAKPNESKTTKANQQNTRNVVTRARSKAKQTK